MRVSEPNIETKIASTMRLVCGYVVCPCGAWNTRDTWHIEVFKNLCYMCNRGLFKPAPPPRFTGFDNVELESPWPAHLFVSMKEFEVNKESRKEAKAKHLSDVEFVNQNGRGK